MSEIIKFIILGILQGFTEPLPISSSGHIILAQSFFGMEELGLSFPIIVNFGSLVAILYFYRESVKELIVGSFKYLFVRGSSDDFHNFKYSILIVVATIPAAIIGFLLEDFIDEKLTSTLTVGISLLVTAFALYLINNIKGNRIDKQVNIKDSIIIGLAQAIALIPGISRSGSTVVAGIGRKLDVDSALKLSFLMYIPVSLGSLIIGIKDIFEDQNLTNYIPHYALAFIFSAIATYFAVKLFYNIMKKGELMIFSVYCSIVGIIAIIFSVL